MIVAPVQAPLRLQRRHAPGVAAIAGAMLGGLHYGDGPAAAPLDAAGVPLIDGGCAEDAWIAGGPVVQGRIGAVRWRHDGRWLWGAVEVAHGDGIEEQARAAYADIFRTLRATGIGHLQRLWNYLPHINADGGGLERYRQFNTGRQRAFLEAGVAAFEGAPAACALGTADGTLAVRFLAGTSAPLPLENPRQVSAYRYPREYGPTSPTFSRAALIAAGDGEVGLLISGTASIVGHASMHPGDAAAQARETLRNLEAVVDAAHRRCSARFALDALECVVYLRDPADALRVREVLDAELGAGSKAVRTAIHAQADICRHDLLVEIEAHAFAPGEVRR